METCIKDKDKLTVQAKCPSCHEGIRAAIGHFGLFCFKQGCTEEMSREFYIEKYRNIIQLDYISKRNIHEYIP